MSIFQHFCYERLICVTCMFILYVHGLCVTCMHAWECVCVCVHDCVCASACLYVCACDTMYCCMNCMFIVSVHSHMPCTPIYNNSQLCLSCSHGTPWVCAMVALLWMCVCTIAQLYVYAACIRMCGCKCLRALVRVLLAHAHIHSYMHI